MLQPTRPAVSPRWGVAANATAVESGPIDETAISVAWADVTPPPPYCASELRSGTRHGPVAHAVSASHAGRRIRSERSTSRASPNSAIVVSQSKRGTTWSKSRFRPSMNAAPLYEIGVGQLPEESTAPRYAVAADLPGLMRPGRVLGEIARHRSCRIDTVRRLHSRNANSRATNNRYRPGSVRSDQPMARTRIEPASTQSELAECCEERRSTPPPGSQNAARCQAHLANPRSESEFPTSAAPVTCHSAARPRARITDGAAPTPDRRRPVAEAEPSRDSA